MILFAATCSYRSDDGAEEGKAACAPIHFGPPSCSRRQDQAARKSAFVSRTVVAGSVAHALGQGRHLLCTFPPVGQTRSGESRSCARRTTSRTGRTTSFADSTMSSSGRTTSRTGRTTPCVDSTTSSSVERRRPQVERRRPQVERRPEHFGRRQREDAPRSVEIERRPRLVE